MKPQTNLQKIAEETFKECEDWDKKHSKKPQPKNCPICQFENGEHSFECPHYKEPKNPMKKKIEKLELTIEYTEDHEVPFDVPPSIREIVEKINEIIDYLNEKENKRM